MRLFFFPPTPSSRLTSIAFASFPAPPLCRSPVISSAPLFSLFIPPPFSPESPASSFFLWCWTFLAMRIDQDVVALLALSFFTHLPPHPPPNRVKSPGGNLIARSMGSVFLIPPSVQFHWFVLLARLDFGCKFRFESSPFSSQSFFPFCAYGPSPFPPPLEKFLII